MEKNLANKNFFSFQNLMFLIDHLIYLIALYLKNKNKKIKIFLFLKKIFSIKNKILIIIIFFMPKKILNILRS